MRARWTVSAIRLSACARKKNSELRRLRKMQGRPILQGKVSIFDLSDDEIDDLFHELNEDSERVD